MSTPYDTAFFDNQRVQSARSADVVVPMVLSLFPNVASVIDIGCGIGTWLQAFRANGIEDVTGLDGDYVDLGRLEIPADRFHATDLSTAFALDRRYDLACSLEVAEHLPASVAEPFIARLCEAAPVVLFSAAIPGQGGTGHVNEAWPDYWRGLFAAHGYRPLDLIRWRIWGRPDIAFWYQQNTLLFADAATLAARPDLTPVDDAVSLNVAHPRAYQQMVDQATPYLSKALRQLPGLVRDAALRRLPA